MLTFIVRRLVLALPVLLGVIFVVMLTIDLLPGDAVTLMLGEHATKEAVAKLRDHLGLDKPFVVRYLEYVGRDASGGARRAARGLRAHGPGQGRGRGVGARPPRPAQRLHPDPHPAGPAVGP